MTQPPRQSAEGFVLVPREPTMHQKLEGESAIRAWSLGHTPFLDAGIAYRAMLATAPPPPTQEQDRRELAAFGASDAACHLYPAEDQQAERAAYIAGAASQDRRGAEPSEREIEAVEGPHEWGYRDLTDGSFIADDAPFNLAQRVRESTSRPLAEPGALREAVARLMEPYLYCQKDAGALNQRGHEMIQEAEAKAARILALLGQPAQERGDSVSQESWRTALPPAEPPSVILTLREDAAAIRRGGFVGSADAFADRLDLAALQLDITTPPPAAPLAGEGDRELIAEVRQRIEWLKWCGAPGSKTLLCDVLPEDISLYGRLADRLSVLTQPREAS